jgi:hypothetical protein
MTQTISVDVSGVGLGKVPDSLKASSVEPLLELSGGPRLDKAQANFRLLASSHTRLEKGIILASAVSYQDHPQRIVNVGGIAAVF